MNVYGKISIRIISVLTEILSYNSYEHTCNICNLIHVIHVYKNVYKQKYTHVHSCTCNCIVYVCICMYVRNVRVCNAYECNIHTYALCNDMHTNKEPRNQQGIHLSIYSTLDFLALMKIGINWK